MKRKKPRRRVSLGTWVALAFTAVVFTLSLSLLSFLSGGDLLPNISGSTIVDLSGMQQLGVGDFLIRPRATQTPTPAPTFTPVPATPTPTATPVPTPTPFGGCKITLSVAGSLCIEDSIRKSSYYSESKKYDMSEIMSLISGEMTGDICIATLENLLVENAKVSNLYAPPASVTMLQALGLTHVNLGYADSLTKGRDALTATLNTLSSYQVLGAYKSKEACKAALVTVKGVPIALVHLTLNNNAPKTRSGYEWMLPGMEEAEQIIADAKAAGAKAVIVSVSWGKNGAATVTKAQKEQAQQLCDLGADIIIGTGTRTVLPAEYLTAADGRKVLCCYGLGALISDSRKNSGVTSMILQLTLNVDPQYRVSISAAYTPTYIWRYQQDGSYRYRVIAADQPDPDGMDDGQKDAKDRAMENLQKYLGADSPLSVRTK